MSEELHEQVEQKGEDQSEQIDVKAIIARMEKLEQTNARLLDESKSYKEKYRTVVSEVENKEKAKLEESENWKELLDREKNEKHQLKDQLSVYKKNIAKKDLHFKVASVAKDAFDITDVISSLPKDMLSLDEESLEFGGIDEAVNFVKEKKPWLFNSGKSAGQTGARPDGTFKPQSMDEKINENPMGMLEECLKDML